MSTSAIVRVFDSKGDDWAIYTPSDGHPDFLGKFLKAFIKTAPRIDPKSPYYKAPLNPSLKWCLITRSPDVSLLASRFLTGFIAYFARVGHSSLYLTRRDPIEEQMISCDTDIDYYYLVQLDGKGRIKMRVIPRKKFKSLAKKRKGVMI